ncbi:MAG: hypothetical protein KA085_02040 [Phenylobacterium sp.]|uniref:SRPBCC family protein n=1 Tax=Phenylobacterium sp. TaxID=1871053 RepID=UPI001B552B8F|nr:hypothetical protein [Phenylobacterium sp.]MBP7650822.1 hypothetical protein [Phenylobacterium sp.]MBP7814877.1 hypothetical protein [Phenylobacterium sp.]MBP9755406.1 hypothetical protein [Phenylobacterium sp.]
MSRADRAITLTRVIDAPASLLFEAYSRPEHIMRWFGRSAGPGHWPTSPRGSAVAKGQAPLGKGGLGAYVL